MSPPFANGMQTALAALVAATVTSLALFVLPGAGVQDRPIPLLPAIGQAIGAVSAPSARPASPHRAVPVVARPPQVVHRPAPAARSRPAAHPVTRVHRARAAVRPAPKAPVAAHASAAPTFAQVHVSPRAKGRALGHAKRDAKRVQTGSPVRAHGRGHGKALGHRHPPRRHPSPHGRSKSVPPARTLSPKSNGHGATNGVGRGGGKR
jgi:hypothetical protein